MITNDPTNPGFDRDRFKHSIGMVESAGGKYLDNPNSSAAGKYHFIYKYLDKKQLNGMTKLEFMNDPDMQERVMDWALDGKLIGYPNYIAKSKEYMDAYGNGRYTQDEVAAMIHFLGKGGARQHMTSGYKVPGKNATVDQYLERYNKHYGLREDKPLIKKDDVLKPLEDQTVQRKDNIPHIPNPVQQPEMPVQQQPQAPEIEGRGFIKTNYQGQGENDVLNWLQNQNAYGGHGTNTGSKELVQYNNGGTHEENPLGGIPIGHAPDGKLNTVEEGETQIKIQGKDYIFSDRLGLNTYYK